MFDYIPFPVFTHTTGMTHFQYNYGVFKLLPCEYASKCELTYSNSELMQHGPIKTL
jgi:hypothetical protein